MHLRVNTWCDGPSRNTRRLQHHNQPASTCQCCAVWTAAHAAHTTTPHTGMVPAGSHAVRLNCVVCVCHYVATVGVASVPAGRSRQFQVVNQPVYRAQVRLSAPPRLPGRSSRRNDCPSDARCIDASLGEPALDLRLQLGACNTRARQGTAAAAALLQAREGRPLHDCISGFAGPMRCQLTVALIP